MQRLAWTAFLALGLAVAGAGLAFAGVRTTVETRSYEVAGGSGMALLDQMDRRGPRHGFRARAIAQTSYSVSWRIEWGETRSACRVISVDGRLAITYTYPKLTGAASPQLRQRWNAFLKGVVAHEERHGEMARQMARAAEKAMLGVRIAGDRGCRKARAEVKRRMAAVYEEYERRQNRFDEREHRAGGPVERLVERLGSVR